MRISGSFTSGSRCSARAACRCHGLKSNYTSNLRHTLFPGWFVRNVACDSSWAWQTPMASQQVVGLMVDVRRPAIDPHHNLGLHL